MLVYRNASDFYVLIWHPATLLNTLISSSNFLILSLGFSMFSMLSCYLQTVRALLLFQSGFFFSFFFFFFLFLLIAVARTSRTILNNSGESGHRAMEETQRGLIL